MNGPLSMRETMKAVLLLRHATAPGGAIRKK